MKEQKDKAPENKSLMATSQEALSQNTGTTTAQFKDNRPEAAQLKVLQKLANTSSKPIQMGKGKHHKRGEFDLYNECKEEIKKENPELPFTSPEIARMAAERFRQKHGEPDGKNKIGK